MADVTFSVFRGSFRELFQMFPRQEICLVNSPCKRIKTSLKQAWWPTSAIPILGRLWHNCITTEDQPDKPGLLTTYTVSKTKQTKLTAFTIKLIEQLFFKWQNKAFFCVKVAHRRVWWHPELQGLRWRPVWPTQPVSGQLGLRRDRVSRKEKAYIFLMILNKNIFVGYFEPC